MRGGSLADLNDLNTSQTERRRRPGILGKTYKHNFASMLSEIDDTFVSSQEMSGQDILSPLNYTSQPETADPNLKLQEKESKDLQSDPFSALNRSPARNSASIELVEQSEHHVQRKKSEVSGELKSQITEMGETRVDDVGSQDMITRESTTSCEKSTNDEGRLRVIIDVLSSRSEGEKYTKGSRNGDGRAVEYNDGRITSDTDARTNSSNEIEEEIMINTDDIQASKHGKMEENVAAMLQEAGSSGDFDCGGSSRSDAEFQTDRPCETEKTVIQINFQVEDTAQDAQPSTNIGQPTIENLDGNQSHQDQSRPAIEPHDVDGSYKNSDALPEEHVKETSRSRVSLDEQSPAKRLPRSKRKTLSHRPSLAGYGISWEAGVRRRKRIKMRPLEYWKGERFLYGLINESLKVIGLKYVSPAKGTGEKSAIRVKSYLSEEYKELFELAALH